MQYELKKCQDQTGMKNDKLDDKTRWELMPLDCLEDIARVYTEGAKKYGDNTWQNLENGYERYKGALLRHLYAAESETFDEETGCRHLAQVAWNAIALLWLSKHSQSQEADVEAARKQKLIDDFWEVMDSYNEVIKADCDARSSKTEKYMFTDKQINKAIKKCPLKDIKIYYREIFNYDGKEEESKERDGRFVYTVEGWYNGDPVLRSNLLRWELIRFSKMLKKISYMKEISIEEKLDKILLNQQVMLLYLRQILQDTNRSQFAEDYAANLAAQATEIILGNNIVRK